MSLASRLLIAFALAGAVVAPVGVRAQSNFGFTPNAATQSMSVTNSSSSITLGSSSGGTVLVQNTGTNTAYITNTGTATTTGLPIVSGGSMFLNFAPGSTVSAITASATTTLLVTKGVGSSAIAGAGSGGGGGGGAVTIADGDDVAEGATADAAASAGSTGTVSAKLRLMTSQLDTISSNVAAALPVCSGSTCAPTKVVCGSAVSSCVLKNATGNLYGVYADCTAACWLMVFNATSAPSNGATTAGVSSGNMVECIDISAGSSKSLSYNVFPANYTVGITAAISSTACATLTLATTGFVSGLVK